MRNVHTSGGGGGGYDELVLWGEESGSEVSRLKGMG